MAVITDRTGHMADFLLVTTPVNLPIIAITPGEFGVEDIPLPKLHATLPLGSMMPYIPSDLIEGGELSMDAEVDPLIKWQDTDTPAASIVGRKQSCVLTWPPEEGKNDGVTWTFTGYVKGVAPSQLSTNERVMQTITVKVASDITIGAAAS